MKGCFSIFILLLGCVFVKDVMLYAADSHPGPLANSARAATAAPTDAAACLAYRSTLKENMEHIAACLKQFSDLSAQPRFGDDGWTASMSTCLAAMEGYAIEGQSISAPPKYRGVQQLYSKGVGQFGEMARIMPKAIEARDNATIIACARRKDIGTEDVHQAMALLNQIH